MKFLWLSLTILLISAISSISIIACEEYETLYRKSSFFIRRANILQQTDNYGLQKQEMQNRHKRNAKPHHLSVHGQKNKSGSKRGRNRRQNGSNFGSAIYFDGSGQLLKLRFITKKGKIVLPDEAFTVQFWAKPEGGQGRFTPIIGTYEREDTTFLQFCL